MSTLKLQPYTGGAGPTKDQVLNNTMVLAAKLKTLGIKFKKDTEFAMEMWGSSDTLLKISKGGPYILVGYDRWGYVIDGMDTDQASLEQTIKDIKDFLKDPSLSSLRGNNQ